MSSPEIRCACNTSVIMRLLTGHPLEQFHCARPFLDETGQAEEKVFVSNLLVLEAYIACQHHYGMAKSAVLDGLDRPLGSSTFLVHPQLLPLFASKSVSTANPGFLDRLIHAEAATVGLPLVTFEKAAGRLPNTRLLGGY